MIKHLRSAADLDADTATLILDTAAEMAALAGREVKKLPTLRGRTVVNLFYEDSTRTRISFEAAGQTAVRRRHQLLREGVERLQGGEPQGHRADPAGDGRRRRRDPAPGQRRAAPAGVGWVDGSVINAGDGTHEHPTQALLDAYTMRSRLGGWTAWTSRSSVMFCTAGWPGRTCCCCARSARRSRWSRPPTLLPVGIVTARGPRRRSSLRPRHRPARRGRGDDAAGADRADAAAVLSLGP